MNVNRSENMASDGRGRRSAADATRQALEALIDEIASESFPASDPPSWGVVDARLRSLEHRSGDTDHV